MHWMLVKDEAFESYLSCNKVTMDDGAAGSGGADGVLDDGDAAMKTGLG